MPKSIFTRAVLGALLGIVMTGAAAAADVTLLNVSYDPTRELYDDINKAFAKECTADTGKTIEINQSHGGSGKQARAVIDGLQADVVTLALAYDIDAICRTRASSRPVGRNDCRTTPRPTPRPSCSWCARAIPKDIKDWDDLVKPGVKVITPNPKTSGGARWNYLAAWGYGAQEARRQRRQGEGIRQGALQATCRCWTPARAARP